MVMFNTRMRPEIIQSFWAAIQAGGLISTVAKGVGTYRVKGRRWIQPRAGSGPIVAVSWWAGGRSSPKFLRAVAHPRPTRYRERGCRFGLRSGASAHRSAIGHCARCYVLPVDQSRQPRPERAFADGHTLG